MEPATPMLGDEKVILKMFMAALAGVAIDVPLVVLVSGLVYDGHGVFAAKILLCAWIVVTVLAFLLLGKLKIFAQTNKLSLQATPTKRSLIFSAKLILLMSAFGALYGVASECREIVAPKEHTISTVEKDIKEGVRVHADTKRLSNGKNETTFAFQNNTKHSFYYSAMVTFEDPQGQRRTETVNSHCFDGAPPLLQSEDSLSLGHENETVVDIEVISLK